jgi:hypothetical protein
MLDISELGPDIVSDNIFKAYALLQNEYSSTTDKYIKILDKLTKAEADRLLYIKTSNEFQMDLNNKDEFKLFVDSDEKVSKLLMVKRKLERYLKQIESTMQMVLNQSYNTSNYIKWVERSTGI